MRQLKPRKLIYKNCPNCRIDSQLVSFIIKSHEKNLINHCRGDIILSVKEFDRVNAN